LFYILVAIIMIGILIALHEFGHFAAAKLCGVKVNEFAIGMGPQILHKRRGETDYSFRLFPIGGFCAMEGEEEGASPDPRAFPNRPWWQRLVILLAGVAMNFLTGALILLCLNAGAERFYEPVVSGFTEGSRAAVQGLQVGDRIWAVDGHRTYLVEDVSLYLSRATGQGAELRADLTVERDGEKLDFAGFELSTWSDEDGTYAGLGIETTVVPGSLGTLTRHTWYQSIDYVRMVWLSLGDLLSGSVGVRDMSGIVGMVDMMSQAGEQGAQAAVEDHQPALLGAVLNILSFVAFISINLAVMNLLPIPALDGGQVLLMAVNGALLKIRGRKLDPKYQNWVTAAGFICLLLLVLVVNVSDILKKFGV